MKLTKQINKLLNVPNVLNKLKTKVDDLESDKLKPNSIELKTR